LTAQNRRRLQSEATHSADWKQQLAEADKLRSQWNAVAWRKAIPKYQALIFQLRRARMRDEEAGVLRSLGVTYLSLGDNDLASQNLTLSLELRKQLRSNDVELVDNLNDLVNIDLLVSNNVQARIHCAESLKISRSLRYDKGEGIALELMGQIEYASGNLSGSLDSYEAALSILKKANDRASLAQTFLDLGYSYSDLSETDKARSSYEQALVLWRSAGNPRGEALTLTALGHLYSKVGEKQKALDLYYNSIRLLEPLEDRIALAFNFDGLGFIHSSLGEKATALEDYTKTLGSYRKAKYQYGEVGVLSKIGEIYVSNEEYTTALTHLNRSMALARTIGDPRMESIPSALIGQVYERQNKLELALQAYTQALNLNRKGKDRREEAYTLNGIGRIHEAYGNKEKALETYKQALELNRSTWDRYGEAGTLYRIAKMEQTLGQLKEAKVHGEQSIALVESLRTGVASHDLRSSYVASVHQQYELYIDILMSLHKQEPSAGFDQAALEASEAGRARTLLETLAESKVQIRQGVDVALLERERVLNQQLELLGMRQLNSSKAGIGAKGAADLETEIQRLTAEYRGIQGQIRARSPQYAALTQPVPLKVAQIKELLEPGTLLLEYALGEKRSFLWAVTNDSVTSYELPSQTNIEKLAQSLYSAIVTSGGETQPAPQRATHSSALSSDYEREAREISSILFSPIANLVEAKRLVIVADGALQYIPFAALPKPNAPIEQENSNSFSTQNLVSRYEIVRIPSASVLAIQRAQLAKRVPAPKSVAVIADPVFDNLDPRVTLTTDRRRQEIRSARARATSSRQTNDFASVSRALREGGVTVNGRIQRLMFSLTEAEAVYNALPPTESFKAVGFKASRATATSSELAQYKVIHIATHGVLNSKHPEFSGIVLSMVDETGQPVDGFLQLHDIYNLNLPAELVVLSACETGIGKQIKGEGLIALTRGFMHAGAARVVASLWKVDDAATAALMAEFYKEMFANGKRPAAALRDAQINISRQHKRWQKPYYWAGFVLQGEWR
jgi:CHAT domain-containing protein/tetratricopeptide (TPR) repeat protein